MKRRCVEWDAVGLMGRETPPRTVQRLKRDFLVKPGDLAPSIYLCPLPSHPLTHGIKETDKAQLHKDNENRRADSR